MRERFVSFEWLCHRLKVWVRGEARRSAGAHLLV